MKKSIFLFLLTLSSISCTSENKKAEVHEIYYFDLKSYFTKEAQKYSEQNIIITKSIAHNQSVENKDLKISNWLEEFALFIDSDINKKAWKDSYTKDSLTNKLIFKAKEEELKTQLIEIEFKLNKPSKIKIINKSHNYLYKTDEVLEYIPDSLYIINKDQKVTVLGTNNYTIKGILKN